MLTAKVYPDCSLTLGIVPRKKARCQDEQYERLQRAQPETDYGALADWYEGTNTIEGKTCNLRERALFIKGPKSSREKRGSYGKHGITRFGKRVVKNGALLLERKYGKKRLGFVTCTLPRFSEKIQRAINGRWSEIIRRFYQKLTRQLQKIGKPCIYVSVTEIQEKRFKKYGVPCPHLHFIYLCRDSPNSRYWLYICQIHRAWNESILEVIALCGLTDSRETEESYGSVHAACIRKSASAYIGKYMSKGCKVIASMQEKGWEEFPKQWWTASALVKKMFKDSIIILDQATASAIFYGLEHYLHEGMIEWARYIEILIKGEYRTVGLIATISKRMYNLLS